MHKPALQLKKCCLNVCICMIYIIYRIQSILTPFTYAYMYMERRPLRQGRLF